MKILLYVLDFQYGVFCTHHKSTTFFYLFLFFFVIAVTFLAFLTLVTKVSSESEAPPAASSSRRRLAAPQVFLPARPAPHVPPPSRCSRSPGGEPPTFSLEQPGSAERVLFKHTRLCYLRQSRKLHVADPFSAFITQQELVHLTSVNLRL